MPDLANFSTVPASPGNLNSPRHKIEGQLVEGSTILNDFTGDNAIFYPDVLATLSVENQNEIVGMVAERLINMKAGA